MRRAVFWIMLLSLVRDRGAMAMSFVLPPAIFLIFAAVFANVGTDKLSLTVAVADAARNGDTRRIVDELAKSPRFRVRSGQADAAAVRRLVANGEADVGIIFAPGAVPFDRLSAEGPAPMLIVADATRLVAAQILIAEIRQIYQASLPGAALGNIVDFVSRWIVPLTPDQRATAAQAIGRFSGPAGDPPRPPPLERLFDVEGANSKGAKGSIEYYAGAIAVLFLLLAAINGGASLLDERETGIMDRIVSSPGGTAVFVDGKLIFITVLGALQVSFIFAVAAAVHGVSLAGVFAPWLVITLAAAWSAGGLALLLAAACSSRRQATNLGNFAALVLSAVGGSMVPRFLMPDWLREAGWLTPNTWALEAYDNVVRRGESLEGVIVPISILVLSGLIGWLGARILCRRAARLG